MGRKKSKTQKQKQAKAARKQFGGVAVQKQRIAGRDRGVIVVNEKQQATRQNGKGQQTQNNNKKKHAKRQPQFSSPSKQQDNSKDTEHADFDRQMASLQQRHESAKKKQHNKRNQKQQHATSLTPATLIVDDCSKPTARLMEEATTRIHDGLAGIGGTNSIPQQSSLAAAAASMNSSVAAWSASNQTSAPSTLEFNNPYAALDGSSDDEEDAKKAASLPTLPLFRLAPPSFAFNNNNTDNNDVDPDL